MAQQLAGRHVAAVLTHGFEERELFEPKKALEAAGATVDIVAPEGPTVRGWANHEWAGSTPVTLTLDDADVDEYDAVLLPGGVLNPDALRLDPRALAFIRNMFDQGKPVAAICHGPWTLIDAGVVYGVRLTSWPSLKSDLTNAGADWVDAEVVVDRGVVSSRKPADIPAFNRRMIEEFAQGRHGGEGRGRHGSPAVGPHLR